MRYVIPVCPKADTHNYLIPLLLNNALPFLDDVCKCSALFVFSCIQSDSSLVRSIAKHGIFECRCNSVIGENATFLCSHFGWQLVNFVNRKTDLSNSGFLSYFYNQVSDTEWCEAELFKDVPTTRDDESEILFACGSGLELSHLDCLILNVATNHALLAIFGAFHVCYCTNSCILCWVCFLFFYLYFEYDFIININNKAVNGRRPKPLYQPNVR